MVVGFTRLDGTGNIVAYVPWDTKMRDFDDKVYGPVNTMKKGDIVVTTLEQANGMLMINKIKILNIKPGEDTPHGFVYQESFNDPNNGSRSFGSPNTSNRWK